jgi:Cu(I)/Ag(I) efflux system protein CusF
MKIHIAVVVAALLAGCTQPANKAELGAATPAQNAGANDAPAPPTQAPADMNMDPAAHQKIAEDAASMGMSAEAHAAMGASRAQAEGAADNSTSATAQAMGMGVIKSIDASAGKVTIAHGPIAALNWPAMTMAFKASPELLAGVKEGDRVHFEFSSTEGGSTLSVLSPQK